MKGHEVARSTFLNGVAPTIDRGLPALSGRVAVAIGYGSQAIRADDSHSRDHGWGPVFFCILTIRDHAKYGRRLQHCLDHWARGEYSGYRMPHHARNWNPGRKPNMIEARITVVTVDGLLQRLVGRSRPPRCHAEWLNLNESRLYWLRHEPVIHDPLGEWSMRKKRFAAYPEPVRMKRITDEMWGFWHYGEYNFLKRVAERNDAVTIQFAIASFIASSMKLCFLLNRDFVPYWKWLHHEFRLQPDAKEVDPTLRRLARSTNADEQKRLVRKVCRYLRDRLIRQRILPRKESGDLSKVIEQLRKRLPKDLRY